MTTDHLKNKNEIIDQNSFPRKRFGERYKKGQAVHTDNQRMEAATKENEKHENEKRQKTVWGHQKMNILVFYLRATS